MKIITINLKENYPSVDIAIATLEIEIERYSKTGYKVLKFIHGYGSSGQGGAIFFNIRKHLAKLKKEGKIASYIFGDKWSLSDEDALKLVLKYKIESDEDINNSNPGITIVELK